MLRDAQDIIQEQAALLAMHGIQTNDGKLEDKWTTLLNEIEQST